MQKKRAAVTLIELLAVLFIAALLIAMVAPALNEATLVRTLVSSSNKIEEDIHLLHEACRSEFCRGYWQVDADGHGYALTLEHEGGASKRILTRRFSNAVTITHKGNITKQVAFNRRGEAFAYCTITCRVGKHQRDIVVSQLGRIRQEDQPW